MAPASTDPAHLPARVIIVHGFRANVDAHWFPWLRDALADRGIEATSVELPLPEAPNAADWEREVALALGTPDERTWIVGHSLGAVTALRALAAQLGDWRLGGVVFVSGFTGTLDTLPDLDDYLAEDVDAERVAERISTRVVIRSDDDTLVPAAASDALARRLSAEVRVQPGAGHFLEATGMTSLPVVLDALLGQHPDR
ncbi:RBBP9/YdeN family alpha/beta hydrolase [Pseudoclavibacter terrae]|uniref:RBBP9/YdeN family alpha/beta hydrolase n=1 Tax=Pseudoclavibacter terrae TaxID=1530195 RepID=UPI0023300259|nr:alpha/beta fold hydrolase [Pseudoclavibacter terrae]